MFAFKVFALCFVLYNIQTSSAGKIKTKLPIEIQELLRDIEIMSLQLESDIATVALLQKHDLDSAKANSKAILKNLKTTVKGAKGTLCGQVASLQMANVEGKADDLKVCAGKDLKQYKSELHSFLKSLNNEAVLSSSYCSFISYSTEDYQICIDKATEGLKNKVDNVEVNIRENLLIVQNKTRDCVQEVSTDLELSAIEIEHNLDVCLNPPTEPATEAPGTEEPATDGSSEGSSSAASSSESSNSSEGSSESSSSSGENTSEASSSQESTSEAAGSEETGTEASGSGETTEAAASGETTDAPESGEASEAPVSGETTGPSTSGEGSEAPASAENSSEGTNVTEGDQTEEPTESETTQASEEGPTGENQSNPEEELTEV